MPGRRLSVSGDPSKIGRLNIRSEEMIFLNVDAQIITKFLENSMSHKQVR